MAAFFFGSIDPMITHYCCVGFCTCPVKKDPARWVSYQFKVIGMSRPDVTQVAIGSVIPSSRTLETASGCPTPPKEVACL